MNEEQAQTVSSLKTVKECMEFESLAKSQGNLIHAKAARERMYEISIDNLRTEEDCEKFAKNAKKLNRPDLEKSVHLKSIDLSIKIYPNSSKLREVEIECLKAVYAYEKSLYIKNRKRTKAAYTWRAIRNHGIISGIERTVCKSVETIGFRHLNKMGLTDYSFEAIVLKYPASFSKEVIVQAKNRLE